MHEAICSLINIVVYVLVVYGNYNINSIGGVIMWLFEFVISICNFITFPSKQYTYTQITFKM